MFDLKNLKSSVATGSEKSEIYKKQVFEGCVTKRDKTRQRGKLRDLLLSYMSDFVKLKDNKTQLQKHFADFQNFYKQCYVTNNFEVSSVSNANMSADNRNLIEQGLKIAKTCLTESKKENKK